MVYHSKWNGYEESVILGCGVFPVKATHKNPAAGPAPKLDLTTVNEQGEEEEQEDVLDEALQYFKPHMLFHTYTIKGNADRLILYLTMFINQCLKKIVGVSKSEAKQILFNFAHEGFSAPGDKAFPFSVFFPAPQGPAEVEKWKEYMKQLRVEMTARLIPKVYQFPEADGTGSKFWMIFAKSNFLGQK
jgi:actin related protein 2/3 complex subunit 3